MERVISLAGQWQFEIDRQDAGIAQRWFARSLVDKMQLPGSLQTQGFGDDISVATEWTGEIVDRSWFTEDRYEKYRQPGNIKIPFWLQPEKHYVGPAWYQREINIPDDWERAGIELLFERVHIESRVWLDEMEIGSNNSLSTPHRYQLGVNLKPGTYRLTLRIDNRLVVDVGINSHSVTDHTQTNWNGIIGRLELIARPAVWIEDAQVHPDISKRKARVSVTIGNAGGQSGTGWLSAGETKVQAHWSGTGGTAELEIPLDAHAVLWDEHTPQLQRLNLRLGDHQKEITFGIRQIETRGADLLINNRPLFLRGTLECCVFPLTGYPPMDVAEWRRVLGIIADYGFNHIRFHSWCPPEAAFAAADEIGLYLQIECASWANTSTTLGNGEPIDQWLYEEAHRILREYGNHPSFIMLAFGNEPGKTVETFSAYLARWVDYWKQQDTRRIYTSGAGWPAIAENQYHIISEPRIQQWGEELNSRINALPPSTTADYRSFIDPALMPGQKVILQSRNSWNTGALDHPRAIISHEIGQWCVYPDLTEIEKYTGLLKARNFEIVRDTLIANHMGDQTADFLHASGKLQILCYKEELESALRTKHFGGYQVLQANDFPGQGTALVGWLNPFWESKGYTSSAEFRRFNNATVILARLNRRVFYSSDSLEAQFEVAHFGAAAFDAIIPYWKLVDDAGITHAAGALPPVSIELGNGTHLGDLQIPLSGMPAPGRYKLVAGLTGTKFENDWDIWVYPSTNSNETPADVPIIHNLDELFAQTRQRHKLIFNPRPAQVSGDVGLGFSSIFWNTLWTRRQAPHTLGILCDPAHPLFKHFPTESHSNWQWWELIHRAAAMVLDDLPPQLRPIVQVIDDWFTNRRLGLIFEARINNCAVLISSIDLSASTQDGPALHQFKRSLRAYVDSPAFNPNQEITAESLGKLIKHAGTVSAVGR